ncbi:hypothetical protein EDC94DRAFT_593086 [Helicostylum pulchrum]|nr:hypothetical protein EDC94DRAFT_593086 [Helicostylum pulchrum]
MDDYAFNDARFLEYCQERELDLREEPIENQTIPQYISNLNEQALQNPDVIYISSDEESENEETDDNVVTGYVEISDTSNDEYEDDVSDSSYTSVLSRNTELDTDDDTSRLDAGCGSRSGRRNTDSSTEVIIIDDDSDEEPVRKTSPFIKLPSKRALRKAERKKKKRRNKKRKRINTRSKIRKVPKILPKALPKALPKVLPRKVKRPERNLDAEIRVAPRGERTDFVLCTECNRLTTRDEEDLLSNLSYLRGNYQPYCLGCARLRAYAVCDEEASDIIRWLATGKIPFYDRPPTPSYTSIASRLITRRRWMEKRVLRNGCNGRELVTSNELFGICIEKEFKCAVSGNYVYFHSGKHARIPYWALSLDHIDPLHHSKENPASWSKNNIQLLSAALNSIKGHVANEELVRWHADFMRSKVIIL